MLSRTFPLENEIKTPYFKAHNESVTLLTWVNAADAWLKSVLIYESKKHKNKNLLQTCWTADQLGQILNLVKLGSQRCNDMVLLYDLFFLRAKIEQINIVETLILVGKGIAVWKL